MEMDSALEEEMNFLTQDDDDIVNNYYYSSSEELTHFSPPVAIKREKSLDILESQSIENTENTKEMVDSKEVGAHDIIEMFPPEVPFIKEEIISVEVARSPEIGTENVDSLSGDESIASPKETILTTKDVSPAIDEENSIPPPRETTPLPEELTLIKDAISFLERETLPKEVTCSPEEVTHTTREEISPSKICREITPPPKEITHPLEQSTPMPMEITPSKASSPQQEVTQPSEKPTEELVSLITIAQSSSPSKEVTPAPEEGASKETETVEVSPDKLDNSSKISSRRQTVDEEDLDGFADVIFNGSYVEVQVCDDDEEKELDSDVEEVSEKNLESEEHDINDRTVINSDHNYVTKSQVRSSPSTSDTSPVDLHVRSFLIEFLEKRSSNGHDDKMKNFVDEIVCRLKTYQRMEDVAKEHKGKVIEVFDSQDLNSFSIGGCSNAIEIPESPSVKLSEVIEIPESQVVDSTKVADSSKTIEIPDTQVTNLEEVIEIPETQVVEPPPVVEIPDSQVVNHSETIEIQESQVPNSTEVIEIPETQVIESSNVIEIHESQAVESSDVIDKSPVTDSPKPIEIAESEVLEIHESQAIEASNVIEIPDSQVVESSKVHEEMEVDEEEKAIEDVLNQSIETVIKDQKDEISIQEELKKTTNIDISIDDLLNPIDDADDKKSEDKEDGSEETTETTDGSDDSTEDTTTSEDLPEDPPDQSKKLARCLEFDLFDEIDELPEEFPSGQGESALVNPRDPEDTSSKDNPESISNDQLEDSSITDPPVVEKEVNQVPESGSTNLPVPPKCYESMETQTDLEFVPKSESISKLYEFASKLLEECRIVSEENYSTFHQEKLDEMMKFVQLFKPLPETAEISIQTEKIVSEKRLKKKNEKERMKLLASSDSSDSESDMLSSDSESKKSFENSELDLSQFLQSDLLVNDEGNVDLGVSEEGSNQLQELKKEKSVREEKESMTEEDLERLRDEEEDREIER